MSNYVYLIIILIACLLGATSILYEQVKNQEKNLLEQAERLERELNS